MDDVWSRSKGSGNGPSVGVKALSVEDDRCRRTGRICSNPDVTARSEGVRCSTGDARRADTVSNEDVDLRSRAGSGLDWLFWDCLLYTSDAADE